jgi:hypothetical protein
MSIPSAWPQVLDFFGTPLVIEGTSCGHIVCMTLPVARSTTP